MELNQKEPAMERPQAGAMLEWKQAESATPEEKAAVAELAGKIDIYNSAQMLQYGSDAQKKIASFSQMALSNIRTKDVGEVGDMIVGLVLELKDFSQKEPKGVMGFFQKGAVKVEKMKTKYGSVEKNVDQIASALDKHKITLLKDITMLDKMYEMNMAYFKELSLYIAAGRERIEAMQEHDLPALREKANLSGRTEDAHIVNDLAERLNRFEKKLYDLDLTRNICLQMAPQIRLVQAGDTVLVEKIQSSLANTIPLWKNQMMLTLGLENSRKAMEAQRQVTDMTNRLLRQNADMLKMSAIEITKESERGIVDIETLRYTNESLIATLDEVVQIQNDGRRQRKDAENELQKMEEELKEKLLALRGSSGTGETETDFTFDNAI